jgi:hypothetical protein
VTICGVRHECADRICLTLSNAYDRRSHANHSVLGQGRQFPKFDLSRLLGTVFKPTFGRKICILIDLPDLAEAKDYAFLKNPARPIQQRAHEHFYLGLKNGVAEELALKGGEMFAYTQTTGSNLDLPDLCVDMNGKELSLEKRHLPELRHHPLHLHLLRHRAAHGLREAVRLPRRHAAWGE